MQDVSPACLVILLEVMGRDFQDFWNGNAEQFST